VTFVSGPNNEPILPSLIATRHELLPQYLVHLVDVSTQAVLVVAFGVAECPRPRGTSRTPERGCRRPGWRLPASERFLLSRGVQMGSRHVLLPLPEAVDSDPHGQLPAHRKTSACGHSFSSRTKTVAPIECS